MGEARREISEIDTLTFKAGKMLIGEAGECPQAWKDSPLHTFSGHTPCARHQDTESKDMEATSRNSWSMGETLMYIISIGTVARASK